MSSTTRATIYGYDFRNRRSSTDGEIDFFENYTYDNQNRITQIDRHNTTATGTLTGRSVINYDNLGRVYQTIRYAVNTGTGAVGNSLVDNLWYDAAGNLIKVKASGSTAFQKMQYDGTRRLTKRYVTYDTAETHGFGVEDRGFHARREDKMNDETALSSIVRGGRS